MLEVPAPSETESARGWEWALTSAGVVSQHIRAAHCHISHLNAGYMSLILNAAGEKEENELMEISPPLPDFFS